MECSATNCSDNLMIDYHGLLCLTMVAKSYWIAVPMAAKSY